MMNNRQKPIHPQQESIRAALRVVGPIIIGIGVLFALVGAVDFFSKAGTSQMPTKFWCFFVGLPLLALGASLARFGFMGSVARYAAGEYAPVAKDTLNYLAEGTTDTVQNLAEAAGRGLAASRGTPSTTDRQSGTFGVRLRCHKCNADNEADAKFCSQCGAALLKTKPCPQCGELNDPDARFCDNCGHSF